MPFLGPWQNPSWNWDYGYELTRIVLWIYYGIHEKINEMIDREDGKWREKDVKSCSNQAELQKGSFSST